MTLADRPIPVAAAPPAVAIRLRACGGCGLVQRLPALARGAVAECSRCGGTLQRRRSDPNGRVLALAITGLCLFLIATQMPFIDLDLRGRQRATTLISGPFELEQHGMWELAMVVMATTIAAPLAKLAATVWVLIGVRLAQPPRHLLRVFRWIEWISPWAMIEVFLLGAFVAYTKLVDLAQVELGGAVYALGGLMLAMAAADRALDHELIWSTLQRKGVTAAPVAALDPALSATPAARARLIGCTCCGLVSAARPHCPRCGAALHRRKPDSLGRCAAFVLAAAALYIPANVLPVMTVVSFGRGQPSTILSGVAELAAAGMWPLAALVFFASITVPVLKLFGLSWLLISARRGRVVHLRQRTRLYRVLDFIGRWSMIDVFMVSILTGLVRMGLLASVYPGPGMIAFCSVVILTMIAAMCFDPRVMWDRAERRASQADGREASAHELRPQAAGRA